MSPALSISPTTTTTIAGHVFVGTAHGPFDWSVWIFAAVAALTGSAGVVAAWIALRRNHTVCHMRSVIVPLVPGRQRVRVYVHIVPGGSTWQITKSETHLWVEGKKYPHAEPRTRGVGTVPAVGTGEQRHELHMEIEETDKPVTVRVRIKFRDGGKATLNETITAQ